jgi:hypothetical protein
MIGQVEKRTSGVQELAKGLSLQVEKLLHETGATSPRSITKSSVDGLVSLFQAVEKLVARVAQLKGQIRETQIKATEMDMWIKKAEAHARTAESPMDSPTPLAITQFVQEFQEADAALQSARTKRELAEAFWNEVVTKEEKSLKGRDRAADLGQSSLQSDDDQGRHATALSHLPPHDIAGVEGHFP